jgi:hypothetical protein
VVFRGTALALRMAEPNRSVEKKTELSVCMMGGHLSRLR